MYLYVLRCITHCDSLVGLVKCVADRCRAPPHRPLLYDVEFIDQLREVHWANICVCHCILEGGLQACLWLAGLAVRQPADVQINFARCSCSNGALPYGC